MKTCFNFSVILLCILATSCNNAPKNSPAESTKESKTTVSPTDQDTISQATFIQWTTLWDSLGKAYSDTSLVKYYQFPIVDMAEFLGTSATKAYFYQGLEQKAPGKYEAHLILTGKDKDGNSIGKYYDVTVPCPPVCDN
jgi:hypothetical protein